MREPLDVFHLTPAKWFAGAIPFAILAVVAGLALAIGSDIEEAVFAGCLSGTCPSFALAAACGDRRGSRERRRYLAAGLISSVLVLTCCVYGRLSGHSAADIRLGLSVALIAIMLATATSVLLDGRVRGDLSR